MNDDIPLIQPEQMLHLDEYIMEIGKNARMAARTLAAASPAQKGDFLHALAQLLVEESSMLLAANAKDMHNAREKNMDPARFDRLRLTPEIIREMADACLYVATLPDPIGVTERQWQQPNGLLVGKMRIPLGVIAMIYESRPNVTIDASIVCLKAGNAVVLRGGSEAFYSNMALAQLLRTALRQADLPVKAAQVLETTDRDAIALLCGLDNYIDVIIPRGGEELVSMVSKHARMPVLKHDKGVCHLFVDENADLEQAIEIIFNSKIQRPAACNALECLLVHKKVAASLLPCLAARLAPHVHFRACPDSLPYLGVGATPLTKEDLGREFHDYILAILCVDSLDAALDHIARYGSHHSEVICTHDQNHAHRFLREADAGMVAVNASTRFHDGGQLGLGAEIGISTSKLHAYGAMGIQELTSTKFVVLGTGQTRK